MSVVKGFKPLGGQHCITNALRQVFEFYHCPISEAMLFGIGSGLGFTYINLANSPMISGRTKPFDFEEKIAKRLKVQIKLKKSKINEGVFNKTVELLKESKPVLVYVDMPYLKYLNLDEENHFGGHAVVIAGVDEEKEIFYVSDRDSKQNPIRTPKGFIGEDYHVVTFKEMEEARQSNHRPFPANNKWLELDFHSAIAVNKDILLEAIKETCDTMLNPPAKLLGINGIEKFSKEVLKWKKFDEDKRKLAGVTNYFMISQDGGTGGGIFRKMYGEFLLECDSFIKGVGLSNIGKDYIEIGEQWDEVAKILWELSETGSVELLTTISSRVKELYEREKKSLLQLGQLV